MYSMPPSAKPMQLQVKQMEILTFHNFFLQASPEETQEGNFGSEHSASPSQDSSHQQFLEVETNIDNSMDVQQQVKFAVSIYIYEM